MPWTKRTRFDESFETVYYEPKRIAGQQPIIHRAKRIKKFWPLDPSLKNKFKNPENLTIVTTHNYSEKSIFEQSLDYLGITEYVVLNKKIKWHPMHKINWILEFLQSGKCKTEYLLFCDARDTIVIDDLQKAFDIFKKMNCELIFNSTISKRGTFLHMPQFFDWVRIVAKKKGRFLNAGAFIGRAKFVQKVFESVVTLTGRLPRRGDDQDILRYLQPIFYPELDLDYLNEIFYRN